MCIQSLLGLERGDEVHGQRLAIVFSHRSRMSPQSVDRRMRRIMGQQHVGGICALQKALGRVADRQFPRFRKLGPNSFDLVANDFPIRRSPLAPGLLSSASATEIRLAALWLRISVTTSEPRSQSWAIRNRFSKQSRTRARDSIAWLSRAIASAPLQFEIERQSSARPMIFGSLGPFEDNLCDGGVDND